MTQDSTTLEEDHDIRVVGAKAVPINFGHRTFVTSLLSLTVRR